MCTIREKQTDILQNILYDYLNYVIGSKDFQLGVDADHEAFVALLHYVHGKHLRSCRDGQLT